MATSFSKTLQSAAANTTADENTNDVQAISLLSDEDEIWTELRDMYKWYEVNGEEEYKDENLSVVDDLKNINVNEKQINITQEENSQYIPFQIPRRYDNVDLTKMLIQIHFVNKDGFEGYDNAVNVKYSDTKIRFGWLVPGNATAVAGVLSFELIARGVNSKGESYTWKTKPNRQLNVLQSLSGNGVIEPDDSWITSFLNLVREEVGKAQTAAQEAQSSAEEIKSTQETITADVTNTIITTVLSNYYTKEEVDAIIEGMDFSYILDEVQKKIDAIDGLANLKVEYDPSTSTMTFKNGDDVIASHVLNTNPTAEWTLSFKQSLTTDISEAVSPVSQKLDDYIASNDEKVNSNTQAIEEHKSNTYTKTEVDQKIISKADSSELSGIKSTIETIETNVETNRTNLSAVSMKVGELEEKVNNFNDSPALEYDTEYNAETGQFTFYETENGVKNIKNQYIISGGGGGGGSTTTTTVKIERITASPLTLTKSDKAIIKYSFSSIDSTGEDTGEGTATWKVGNSIVATTIAIQGENTFDISEFVSVGTQKITLSITDAAGAIAVKSWTIQVIDAKIESTFNDTVTYPVGKLSFDYIPYGAVEKTVHFLLDGIEIGTTVTSSSGIPMSYSIPEQEHGSHLLEAYITANINNTVIETNHIYKDILFYDSEVGTPVIGCVSQNVSVQQYDNLNITYTVYDPLTETPNVALYVDDKVVSNLILDKNTQIWQFKSSDVGLHVLKIKCRDTEKIINVTVEKLSIDIEPVTANLAFDFNPTGKSNNDENRLWTDGTTSMSVSDNFDWVNGGYQLDENGDQYFCIKAGTTATIDYNLFSDDARKNGKEFKVVFKTTKVRKSSATFLSCVSGIIPIGIQMNVHEAYIRSSAKSLYAPYSEEDIIEFEFNINKDTDIPIVMTYEDGCPNRPMSYTSDYNFTQSSPVPITIGSPYCDVHIYRMKVYSSSLTDSGVLTNFIADARNATEMINRYKRNQIYDENNQLTPESVANACPDLKVIKIDCPHFTNDKKDFVLNTNIECIHVGGDSVYDNWKAINCAHSGQGTTSNEYGAAGRNMDLLMCFDGVYTNSKIPFDENYKTVLTLGDGTKYEDGSGKITLTRNSVPTNYLNIKVNIASSENANNALGQKRFNDYLPYESITHKKNNKVKNTMEFVNCVVFVRENDPDLSTHREFQDNEYHFYAIGNVGDSKKTDYSRVNDPTDPKEFVVEIMDNTLPNSTFSGTEEALAALDADTFNEKGTYGFRYEMSGITDEQRNANIQTWKDFYRFVATSTDEEFVSNLKNWFIVDSALYFYLFTERYTMIDNRAKNTFWHYAKVYISQEEADSLGEEAKYYTIDDEAASVNNGYRFDLWGYDFDTQLGINNSGELTMTYGKEDTDYRTDGDASSGYIFNAAESKFFCRIRDLMRNELASMFISRESKNCWSSSSLINEFDNSQEQFPEELWRLDYERKYKRTYSNGNTRFLESMMNGKKKYQRRQFERDQEKYMATKYFGTTATSDQVMFRCNTPVSAVVAPNYTLHLIPYADMYLSVMFGATYRTQVRAKAGIRYDIECPFSTMDDTAVLIYCASQIQSFGDLSACYIHDNDFSHAKKAEVLIIGNDTDGYQNVFLTNLVLGNNELLEKLDIRNTPNLVQSLNLSDCYNLKELYAEGSGLTGVTFANGGNITIAHIPDVTSLNAKNLTRLEDLQIAGFDNLHTLVVENTPVIDTYTYTVSSPNLTNVRLIGIDWGTDEGITNTDILDRLLEIAGVDNSGYNTPISVLTGTFYSPTVRQRSLEEYNDAWTDLNITYDTLITQCKVTFQNEDGTVLDTQYVDKGGNAVDPITREKNPIPVPTKESTISTNFTFKEWDSVLTNVFVDRVITATYTESLRTYTVRYVSKGVTLYENSGKYGDVIDYVGDMPVYTSEESGYVYYLFNRWDKSGIIDGEKIVNAIFDRFEYTDGYFTGKELSSLTPVEIYAMTKLAQEQNILQDKDPMSITFGKDYDFDDVSSEVIVSEKTTFNGQKYIDTGIKLFDEDRDFILAIDYEFLNNSTTGSVLAQCYQSNGSNGFKLWYNNSVKFSWGTSSTDTSSLNNREIVIIRHRKGENNLLIYNSKLDKSEPEVVEIARSKTTSADSTLVFGCAKADDGAFENYAVGNIYWCKIWYGDLGDNICKNLALWTHETVGFEVSGFKKYYLTDNPTKRCSFSLLATHLLERNRVLNTISSTKGGWNSMTLNTFLNDRMYKSIPDQWLPLIKQVTVLSSLGDKSTELGESNCYIIIPACIEVDPSMTSEPYVNEDKSISYMTTNETRKRAYDGGEYGSYWLRSPNASYSSYIYQVDSDGNTYGYSYPNYTSGVLIELSI